MANGKFWRQLQFNGQVQPSDTSLDLTLSRRKAAEQRASPYTKKSVLGKRPTAAGPLRVAAWADNKSAFSARQQCDHPICGERVLDPTDIMQRA